MATDFGKTLDALKTAIQMEIDGKEYYLKAAEASGNPLGTKLFKTLAREEDSHREKFEKIFKSIQTENSWPDITITPHATQELKTLFASASRDVKSTSSEMEAIQTAKNMENKTRDFYNGRAKIAEFEAEKKYFIALSGEEAAHHAALNDYYEYLKNPADWFTMKERHSLDGG